MSDGMWNIDESQDTPLIKQLRQQIKARDDELSTMRNSLADISKRDRQRSVSDALREVGAKPSLARFFPEGTEPTKESVTQWLKENEDVFGPGVPQGEDQTTSTPDAPATPQATIDAFNRMNTADASGVTTSPDLEAQMISQLQSMRDASGGDADTFVAFLRGERTI